MIKFLVHKKLQNYIQKILNVMFTKMLLFENIVSTQVNFFSAWGLCTYNNVHSWQTQSLYV